MCKKEFWQYIRSEQDVGFAYYTLNDLFSVDALFARKDVGNAAAEH